MRLSFSISNALTLLLSAEMCLSFSIDEHTMQERMNFDTFSPRCFASMIILNCSESEGTDKLTIVLVVIHSPTHICIDACMNINSPAHDLHTFILFSPNLNSLTLKVVGQWSHFSPILPAIRSSVIKTAVNYAGIPPPLIGITSLPLRLRGL